MAPTEPAGGDLPSERPRRQSLPDPELGEEAQNTRRDDLTGVTRAGPTAAPPRRLAPGERSTLGRLSGPDLVVFAPGVSAASAPAPTFDESHEIKFDDERDGGSEDAGRRPGEPEPGPSGPERGLHPLGAHLRAGRSLRLFWLWFAGNASLLGVVVGGILFSLGLSLRQSLVATAVGLLLSTIPIAVGTLAVRATGQPTLVVSRAVFGLRGNALPATVMLVARISWGAVLLWLLAATIARILVGSAIVEDELPATLVTLAIALILAVGVAALDHRIIARLQQVIAVVSTLLVLGFMALTVDRIDLRVAVTVGDGPWVLVLAGAVVVFSVFGLLWANSASDLSRHQRASSSSTARVGWATAGAAIPAAVLVAYGALLASSDPGTAVGLLEDPVAAITALLPPWHPLPLAAAVGLGLLSAVAITVYSAGFALQSLVPRLDRRVALAVVAVALAAAAVALAVSLADFTPVVSDLATTIAVPVAACTSVLGATLLLRRQPIDGESLLETPWYVGHPYPAVGVGPLVAFVAATVCGFGFTTAALPWLAWQGYLLPLVGIDSAGALGASDSGVLLAFALGFLIPLLVAIVRGGSGAGAHRPGRVGEVPGAGRVTRPR